MTRFIFITLTALFLQIQTAYSKVNKKSIDKEKQAATEKILQTAPLSEQFSKLKEVSNSYKKYRIVKETWFTQLQQNTIDTVGNYKRMLDANSEKLNNQSQELDELQIKTNKYKVELENTTTRNTNNTFLTISCFILLVLTIVLGQKVRGHRQYSKQAQEDIDNLEKEFAQHKVRALEREQKVMRKLQDEINKQKGI